MRHFSKSNLADSNMVDHSEVVVLFTYNALTHYPLTIDVPGGDLPGRSVGESPLLHQVTRICC